ncbi:MAG: hypothetical protein LC648_10950 [Novosphingobium sp.]|nr:hypothetical protein [Novosphingobium sp.]
MFGLFKPKLAPTGPHSFVVEVDVAVSAAEFFALVDFADPRNAQRARGASIEAKDGDGRRFLMKLPRLEDLDFHIDVIEAEAPNHYAYAIVIDPLVGRLAASTEAYTIWDVPGGGCRVRFENTVTFQDGLRMKHIEEEFAKVTVASFNALAKLKLQAEQGVAAIRAFEERQFHG